MTDSTFSILFWERVEANDPDDCWIWTGPTRPAGYGTFGLDYMVYYAHRVSYSLFCGPVPEGLVIDHLCRNRGCVNPAHLEAVTQAENIRRGKRGVLRTACKNGHQYNEENTLVDKQGHRRCRVCNRARDRVARGVKNPYKP